MNKISIVLVGVAATMQSIYSQDVRLSPEERVTKIQIEGIAPSSHRIIKQSLTTTYPSFVWPVELDLYDRLGIANYPDEDPGGGIAEYNGGTIAYDGHRGTDIALHNFRLMDRGTKILAAAPGVVSLVIDSAFDRSKAPNFNTGNYIVVQHAGGTESLYFHLR
ncbi:MAG: M23 family metallopeptidase, partial [bacterium]